MGERTRLVRHVVQVASRIRRLVVDRGEKHRLADALERENRLDGPGRADGVAQHRFVRAEREGGRARAEDALDGERLEGVVLHRGGPVRVDVADVGALDPGILDRPDHREDCALGLRMDVRDAVGIGRVTIAEELTEDRRAAVPGMHEILEDERTGPFGDHEAAALAIEWAGRAIKSAAVPRA